MKKENAHVVIVTTWRKRLPFFFNVLQAISVLHYGSEFGIMKLYCMKLEFIALFHFHALPGN